MIIPIRCISCGKPIGHLWEEFKERVEEKGEDSKKVLDELGLERYCCRSIFLGQVDNLELINKLENFEYRRKKEQELEELLNIPAGHVIIDVPRKELYQAEPRINQTDIIIIDEKDQKKIDFYTPVAKAIKSRVIPEWIVMIVADERYRDILSKKAEKILFS